MEASFMAAIKGICISLIPPLLLSMSQFLELQWTKNMGKRSYFSQHGYPGIINLASTFCSITSPLEWDAPKIRMVLTLLLFRRVAKTWLFVFGKGRWDPPPSLHFLWCTVFSACHLLSSKDFIAISSFGCCELTIGTQQWSLLFAQYLFIYLKHFDIHPSYKKLWAAAHVWSLVKFNLVLGLFVHVQLRMYCKPILLI